MKILITALLFFSANLYAGEQGKHPAHAETMAQKAKAMDMPEDKFAAMCSFLEAHILDTHNSIVEIDRKNTAAAEAGVRPSESMLKASLTQWAHQAQDAGIYGNLRCFEREANMVQHEVEYFIKKE